ncbi:MAG: S8 family serine peptidase, partial [Acidobacteria bacterium]|nr:S8 family serine peptidase [Acidobacteriota bacterium]
MRRVLIAAVVLALLGLARPAAAESGTTRLIVKLDGSPSIAVDKILDDLADAHSAPTSMRAYQSIPWAAIEVPTSKANVIEASGGTDSVVLDGKSRPSLDSTVPIVKADQMSAAGYDGTGYNVAVIDTGVDKTHPFLTNKVVAEGCFSNIAHDCPGGLGTSIASGSGAPCAYVECEHGTHVAGIAAGLRVSGSAGPARGVAPGAGIVSLRVFTGDSTGAFAYDSDILAALDWAYTNRATYHLAAVNLSLGGSALSSGVCPNSAYSTIFGNLAAAGVAPVVAAGNSGSTTGMTSPACVANAISVAATTDGDAFASFSNRNALTSLAAPGVSVTSSVPGGGFQTWGGTSMAAPHVAGA